MPNPESQSKAAHNLPIQPTSFVGRERDIAEVERLLATTRLLTLTGAGGVGKTRLALQVAARVLDRFADGAWLVELAPLADPTLLAGTVATALGVREQVEPLILEALIDALRTQNLLLILDNCEHLIDGCARLAHTLLGACPNLRVLATSREPLNIAGEIAWSVPSLALPPTGRLLAKVLEARVPAHGERKAVAELMRYDAVRLFMERAQAVQPGFSLTPQNAAAVDELCRELDGIPLALELAAARMRALSVEQVGARLQRRFRLLTTGGRTAAPRHQTLRALVDWSHDLLSEPEKLLLRRLSIFAGGWTLEAAESVCAADGLERDDVLDRLSQLVDKSLVLGEQHEAEKRYRLLETVRQYALEKLQESGEEPALRQRHLLWYRELVGRLQIGAHGAAQAADLIRVEVELGNLRAALEWSKTDLTALEEGLRLSGALMHFWYFRGHAAEGERWLYTLLALAPAHEVSHDAPRSFQAARALGLTAAAFLATRQRHTAVARRLQEEVLTLWRELDDKWGIAFTLRELARLAVEQEGEPERAEPLLEESLGLAHELESPLLIFETVYVMGLQAHAQRDYGRAQLLVEEALAMGQEQGDTRRVSVVQLRLGRLALEQGDLATARDRFQESLLSSRRAGVKIGFAAGFEFLAFVAAAESQPGRALRLAGAAAAAARATGTDEDEYTARLVEADRWLEPARKALGEQAATAWAEGEAMTLEQALAYALAADEPASSTKPPYPRDAGPLTARERKVAELVVGGLTNRQIAAELFISEATAKRHVETILAKLGLTSRVQLAAWVAGQDSLIEQHI